MSKIIYFLTISMMAFNTYSFAEEGEECPEGMIFDPGTESCIESPVESPIEAPEGSY